MAHEHILGSFHPSPLIRKNIIVNNRRTSLRIEPNVWDAFHEIGRREHLTVHELAGLIENRLGDYRYYPDSATVSEESEAAGRSNDDREARNRGAITLTAAIRVFIMNYFRQLAQGTAPPHDGPISPGIPANEAGCARAKLKDEYN